MVDWASRCSKLVDLPLGDVAEAAVGVTASEDVKPEGTPAVTPEVVCEGVDEVKPEVVVEGVEEMAGLVE